MAKMHKVEINAGVKSSVSVSGIGLKAGLDMLKGWFQKVFTGIHLEQDDSGQRIDFSSNIKREKFDDWYSETPELLPSDQKLPQSRMYLKSAHWGFQSLLEQNLSGYGYRFYIIGILAALRAVQHSLDAHDRKLSATHQNVIGAWWKKTSNLKQYPHLQFIKNARDQILKAGSFESFATHTESAIGEGSNYTVTGTEYELAYYDGEGNRHDLKEAIESAMTWCDSELTEIEAEIELGLKAKGKT
jgi:hypothetical protein